MRKRNMCILGAGETGKQALSNIRVEDYEHLYFYDNDRRKWGTEFCGYFVEDLDFLLGFVKEEDYVLVIATKAKTALYFVKDIEIKKCDILYFNSVTNEFERFDDICPEDDGFNRFLDELEAKKLEKYRSIAEEYKSNGNELMYRHTLSYIKYKGENPYSPEIVGIELTNYCNLRCPNCPVPTAKRERGFMNDEIFEESLKYIPPHNDEHFVIHGFGEPLLHKKLVDYIRILNEHDVKIVMSTNGVLFDDINLPIVLEELNKGRSPLLYVSFHLFESVQAWKKCIDYIQDNGLNNMTLYGQVIEHNQEEVETWLAEVGVNNPKSHKNIRYITSHSFGGHVEGRTTKYTDVEVANRIRNCHHVKNNLATIAWDGKIRACCMDSEADSGLGTVFNMESVRTKKYGYPWCRNCDPDWESSFQ